MAARTSAGVGVGVTVTLLGVLSLALFITTIVFLSKYQRAERDLRTLEQETEVFVTRNERQRDDVNRIKDAASRARPAKSVVAYLNESLRTAMQRVSNAPGDTIEQMAAKLDKVEGATGNSLLGVIRDRETEIARLTSDSRAADEARATALANLDNEVQRVNRLQQSHQETIATLNADIDGYKTEVDSYRESVNQAKADMDKRVGQIQQRADAEKALLNQQIERLKNENLTLNETIAKLRARGTNEVFKPKDEYALVDGTVVGVNPSAQEVYVSLGEKDKIALGMTFAVYSEAKAIRPDPGTGEYPRGKATLEVINVGDDSSTCRITGEIRGNPVVKNDVIANAVYDPGKVYKFVVYGVFDANGDGRLSELEADDVKTVIQSWGGEIVDDLVGDVDFLVLGARPMLPPEPGSNAPIEVVLEYQRLRDKASRYDDLLKQAGATSLPVLNQNRLYTLVGRRIGGR